MAYSMTGFGRGEKLFDSRRYSVEIKSVNSRFCDINIRMPRIFNFAEAGLRKQISDRLKRGKVDVFINYDDTDSEGTELIANEGLAKAYSEAATNMSSLTGRTDDLAISRLMSFPDVLIVRQKNVDEERLLAELTATLNEALDGIMQMRLVEGNNLCEDILKKVSSLETLRDEIATHAPQVVLDYRQRLSDRIDDILTSEQRAFYDDARLAAEVSVFADKCAIDEEMKRLVSHFDQARKILGSKDPVGKKMDFLIQEINREVNTTGSKANDIEITNRVLQMKNLIEEMREQVQNLV